MLDAIFGYYDSIMLHVPFSKTLNSAPVWKTDYDLLAWRKSDFDPELQRFKFGSPQKFQTKVDQRIKSTLTSRIDTFGEHASGLGRFTRTMFATDFRRQIAPASDKVIAEKMQAS